MKRSFILISTICLFLFVVNSTSVFAHDGDISVSITSWDPCDVGHDDESPWKGWANITVYNSMAQDWGDFHFEIYEFETTNVFFNVTGPN